MAYLSLQRLTGHGSWSIYENFYCKLCADKREQFLKSGFGYRFRKIIIQHYEKLSSDEKLSSALQNGV